MNRFRQILAAAKAGGIKQGERQGQADKDHQTLSGGTLDAQ
jgi:hypothetical protein